jgi:hypothetical protein
MVELLISHGADINFKNQESETPLSQACWNNRLSIIELLISQGVDLDAKCSKSKTAIEIALWRNNWDLVKLLISKGANVNPGIWRSPLFQAVQEDNFEVAKFLIENGANVNCISVDGPLDKMLFKTALQLAIENLNYELAELLLANGAEIYPTYEDKLRNTSSLSDDTLLHTVVKMNNIRLADLLLSYGADTNKKNSLGKTPLVYAEDIHMIELLKKSMNLNVVYDETTDVENIFKTMLRCHGEKVGSFISDSSVFNSRVESYFSIFCRCFSYKAKSYTVNGSGYNYTDYTEYDFSEGLKAIEELSNLNNPISINLLHLISDVKKGDVKVFFSREFRSHDDCSYDSWNYLSYDSVKAKALKELAKKGNPPYDSKAFMDKKAWEFIEI